MHIISNIGFNVVRKCFNFSLKKYILFIFYLILSYLSYLFLSNFMSFQVNYIKALDKYLIGCFMFVFSVLAEYSIILAINGKIRKRKQKLEQEVSSNNDTNYI